MEKPDTDSLIKELVFKASRSGGKGGQNVNKVSTKVEIHFNIQNSSVLTDEQKEHLSMKLESKISEEGTIRLFSTEERTQVGNKKKVLEKFRRLISSAFTVRKKRVPTKASRSSKEKRLKEKKLHSEIKKLRRGEF